MINETVPVWNITIPENITLVKYSVDCVDFVTSKINLDCLIDDQVFQLKRVIVLLIVVIFILMFTKDLVYHFYNKYWKQYEKLKRIFMIMLLAIVLYIGGYLNKWQIVAMILIIGLGSYLISRVISQDT